MGGGGGGGGRVFFYNPHSATSVALTGSVQTLNDCIVFYVFLKQTNAKLTNKIHIIHYFFILNSADDVIYLIVENNPCPKSRN